MAHSQGVNAVNVIWHDRSNDEWSHPLQIEFRGLSSRRKHLIEPDRFQGFDKEPLIVAGRARVFPLLDMRVGVVLQRSCVVRRVLNILSA